VGQGNESIRGHTGADFRLTATIDGVELRFSSAEGGVCRSFQVARDERAGPEQLVERPCPEDAQEPAGFQAVTGLPDRQR
jgi:hypothetical protein